MTTIKAARDAEAGVWYIADSDLSGLNLEGESLDELYDKLLPDLTLRARALMSFTTNYFTGLRK